MNHAQDLTSEHEDFNLEHLEDHPDPQEEPDHPSASAVSWAIALFGTAVGAGILFLPIDAGSFGFWPLIIATIGIGPLVYFAHRNYARIVSAAPVQGLDVLQVVTALTGRKRGLATALIYWLTVYPTVLIYGISLTNTVDSFLVNQLGREPLNRWLLATLCVGAMTAALAVGKQFVLKLTNWLVYPLIISLAAVSLFLIPRWDLASFMSYRSDIPLWQALLLILPVMVFSFSHMAALSQFALSIQQEHIGDEEATERKVAHIELMTAIALVGFTMFFVWSCVLALGANGMIEAREANVPVLSYLANVTHAPILAYISPIVATFAILSSFYGHMLGTEESSKYVVRVIAPETAEKLRGKKLTYVIYLATFFLTVAVAVANPSILDLISVVGGVFVGFLVFILPMLLFRKTKAYGHFASHPSTIAVFIIGLVVIAVATWQVF